MASQPQPFHGEASLNPQAKSSPTELALRVLQHKTSNAYESTREAIAERRRPFRRAEVNFRVQEAVIRDFLATCWIDRIDRIVLDIDVRVPAKPTALHALYGVSGPEPPGGLVVVPCP